jgi:1-acyl-sn-glycerol-3-phosphate acyltransferase
MGKDALFRRPFKAFFRWLGGIPVDRSKPHNAVEQMVEIFAARESFILAVAPEGTRKRVEDWKTGFYRIAYGAGVPIVLGFIDYGRREGGIGPVVRPSGNLEADMEKIRAFYASKTGKYADQSGRASVAARR